MPERSCTAHYNPEPIEAEPVVQGSLNYIMLRCHQCGRPVGMRLVRRNKATAS